MGGIRTAGDMVARMEMRRYRLKDAKEYVAKKLGVDVSVLSDEFEDEYSETNRGEVYRIIATVIEIVRIYHSFHIHSDTYEFTGEFKDSKDKQTASIRTRLYYRYAQKILNPEWKPYLEGNKVIVKKMN